MNVVKWCFPWGPGRNGYQVIRHRKKGYFLWLLLGFQSEDPLGNPEEIQPTPGSVEFRATSNSTGTRPLFEFQRAGSLPWAHVKKTLQLVKSDATTQVWGGGIAVWFPGDRATARVWGIVTTNRITNGRTTNFEYWNEKNALVESKEP